MATLGWGCTSLAIGPAVVRAVLGGESGHPPAPPCQWDASLSLRRCGTLSGQGSTAGGKRGYALAAVATSWLQNWGVARVEVGDRGAMAAVVAGSCHCQPARVGIPAVAGPCRAWAARSLGLPAFPGWGCRAGPSCHEVPGWLGPWVTLHPCRVWGQCLF